MLLHNTTLVLSRLRISVWIHTLYLRRLYSAGLSRPAPWINALAVVPI